MLNYFLPYIIMTTSDGQPQIKLRFHNGDLTCIQHLSREGALLDAAETLLGRASPRPVLEHIKPLVGPLLDLDAYLRGADTALEELDDVSTQEAAYEAAQTLKRLIFSAKTLETAMIDVAAKQRSSSLTAHPVWTLCDLKHSLSLMAAKHLAAELGQPNLVQVKGAVVQVSFDPTPVLQVALSQQKAADAWALKIADMWARARA